MKIDLEKMDTNELGELCEALYKRAPHLYLSIIPIDEVIANMQKPEDLVEHLREMGLICQNMKDNVK